MPLTPTQIDNISTNIFNNLKTVIQNNFPNLTRREAQLIMKAVNDKFLQDLADGAY